MGMDDMSSEEKNAVDTIMSIVAYANDSLNMTHKDEHASVAVGFMEDSTDGKSAPGKRDKIEDGKNAESKTEDKESGDEAPAIAEPVHESNATTFDPNDVTVDTEKTESAAVPGKDGAGKKDLKEDASECDGSSNGTDENKDKSKELNPNFDEANFKDVLARFGNVTEYEDLTEDSKTLMRDYEDDVSIFDHKIWGKIDRLLKWTVVGTGALFIVFLAFGIVWWFWKRSLLFGIVSFAALILFLQFLYVKKQSMDALMRPEVDSYFIVNFAPEWSRTAKYDELVEKCDTVKTDVDAGAEFLTNIRRQALVMRIFLRELPSIAPDDETIGKVHEIMDRLAGWTLSTSDDYEETAESVDALKSAKRYWILDNNASSFKGRTVRWWKTNIFN